MVVVGGMVVSLAVIQHRHRWCRSSKYLETVEHQACVPVDEHAAWSSAVPELQADALQSASFLAAS